MAQARLIGLDWGTSSLRAYLFDASGTVLAVKARPWGVMSRPDGEFAAAYHETVDEWRAIDSQLPAIAAGMIGSTEGWIPAPYCPCPAGARELATALVSLATSDDGVVHVIPGVELRGSAPNVMRGEETQVAGALALRPELAHEATLVLPGTHAKWVEVRDGRITRFTTYMTGELYAVLSEYSILGRPARKAAAHLQTERRVAWNAFDRGVTAAYENASGGIAPLLFLARTLVLQEALRAEDSLDFLSGLLIGDELRSALDAVANFALIGDAALCERYRRALSAFGVPDALILDATAPAGLWYIACQAGLVAAPISHV